MDETRPTRLILIPAGRTCWEDDERLVGNADLPLCTEGVERVKRWAGQLRETGLEVLFSVPGGAGEETARLIAETIRLRPRQDKELAEINLGLWQGLSLSEVRTRHPKVYKQWLETPDRVTPPEGERLVAAQERLEACLRKLTKKYQGHCLGVVLGGISLTLVRLSREGKNLSDFWNLMKEPLTWHEYLIESGETGNNQQTEDF
jgi:broad specificity phosphatase PhoE